MVSIIIYAFISLWLIVMLAAVAVPVFIDRPKRGARLTQQPPAIPFRRQAAASGETKQSVDRAA